MYTSTRPYGCWKNLPKAHTAACVCRWTRQPLPSLEPQPVNISRRYQIGCYNLALSWSTDPLASKLIDVIRNDNIPVANYKWYRTCNMACFLRGWLVQSNSPIGKPGSNIKTIGVEQHRNLEINTCHKHTFSYRCSGHSTRRTNQTKYISQWQNPRSDTISLETLRYDISDA